MKRPRAIFLLLSLGALLVYLAGAVWHLDLARQPPEALWGDAGDGLFNGWILEQGLRSAPGGFQELRAGRIFWPDGANSFFWSDNLLAVLPLYALARALTPGLLEALRWTVHGLSGLHYAALVFLFYQACALATVGAPPRSRRGLWAVPLFAYWAHFTPQLILNHFNHLQNFCGLGLFVFAGAALAYRRRPAGRWIVLMAVAALGLLYSAPYYAVAVFVLGLGWGALEAVAHPRELMTRARRAAPGLLVVALVAWPLLRAYLDARLPTYAPRDLIRLAIAWTSVYTPAATVSADWLRRAGCALPAVSSEQLAWWGGGWLLGLILAVSRWGRVRWGGWSAGWWRQPVLGLILLALFAPQLKIRELRPVLPLIGLVGWAGLLSWLIGRAGRWGRAAPRRLGLAFLLLGAGLLYGVALGPHARYLEHPLNPSLWGLARWIVPGASSLRALGRLSYPASVLLLAALALTFWTWLQRVPAPARRRLGLILLLCGLLQTADCLPLRAPWRPYGEDRINPTAAERDMFSQIEGALLLLPAAPFARNAQYMLLFRDFPNLRLMNGYSGHSTPRWDEIMRLEQTHGPGDPRQLARARAAGVDYIAFRTRYFGPRRHPLPCPADVVTPSRSDLRWILAATKDCTPSPNE